MRFIVVQISPPEAPAATLGRSAGDIFTTLKMAQKKA